jgi:D-alanine--poly(phosphoribitol) ligase subunit 1
MRMLERIRESCERYSGRNAFYIHKNYHSYKELAGKITSVRSLISCWKLEKGSLIGVLTNDDIETYASIFAIWFEGHVFVPISSRNPAERNGSIIDQTSIKYILSSSNDSASIPNGHFDKLVSTLLPASEKIDLHFPELRGDDLLYILFTSGSTGIPKGVMLSRSNFDNFLDNFIGIGYEFSQEDRFLQIYDLSFDASLHCYVLPLCFGACVYTVPQNEVKYTFALKLMRDHDLTFAKMPPSTIVYLRPFFKDIKLEKLRYSLFGGEPLYVDIAMEWMQCIPNARMQNVYGPTEATINCSYYDCGPGKIPLKSFNGIVSIGKTFGDSKVLIIDEFDQQVCDGARGELCISGSQVTEGYFNNPGKTASSFLQLNSPTGDLRYYRTGDIVMRDPEGELLYIGRVDNQVQIQGFRVEMGEIESHARNFPNAGQLAAIAVPNDLGNMQVYLVMENFNASVDDLKEFLKDKLPSYMWPARIISVAEFPKTVGGKIDRKALSEFANK